MIDTLNFIISDFVINEEVVRRLNLSASTSVITGEVRSYKGYLKNLFLNVIPNEKGNMDLYVKGSIRKYFFGVCALDDLSYNEFWKALRKLASDLGITFQELQRAKIHRIDIGFTLKVPHPVDQYLNVIYSTAKMKKGIEYKHETRGFKATNKEIKFYDKYKEAKKDCQKKGSPPFQLTYQGNPVIGKNWLRIEEQFTKVSGLHKQLNNLTSVFQLYTKMHILIERFLKDFESIKFVSVSKIHFTQPLTKIVDIVTAALIYTNGDCKTTLGLLEQLKILGIIGPEKLNAVKNKVEDMSKKLINKGERNYKKSLLYLLERKLKEKYKYYLADIKCKPVSKGGNLDETPLFTGIKFQYIDSDTLMPIE